MRSESPQSILLVEHDPETGSQIAEQLIADGYPTSVALTAGHARALAAISTPVLAILGRLDPPDGTLGLLREIRRGEGPWQANLLVVVLGSQVSRPAAMLRAFATGADDFLACPDGLSGCEGAALDYLELCARLRSLLRRAAGSPEVSHRRIRVGPLVIDTSSRSVLLHQHPVRLRPREYELLLHLAREPTRVFTKHELLHALWDCQAPSRTRTLDSHACRLRGKLAGHSQERWVLNVRGVGYRLTS